MAFTQQWGRRFDPQAPLLAGVELAWMQAASVGNPLPGRPTVVAVAQAINGS
jgi:hypothetical protein